MDAKKIDELARRLATGVLFGIVFWGTFLWLPPYCFSAILALILVIILCFEWRNFLSRKAPYVWALMPVYPVLPFVLLIVLNQNPIFRPLLYYLFIMVFTHDTASYVVGMLAGTKKIMPCVSPGKSWQGFFGGFFATIGAVRLTMWEFSISRSLATVATVSWVICVIALAGDLFESWLKRRAGIKDSGCLLPGHGGFLDRFDGVLFAAFFFYWYRYDLMPLFVGVGV